MECERFVGTGIASNAEEKNVSPKSFMRDKKENCQKCIYKKLTLSKEYESLYFLEFCGIQTQTIDSVVNHKVQWLIWQLLPPRI